MLKRLAIPSPNYSSRGGSNVRLVVIHTAEGATTIQSLGSFFANPASQVSSHTGADDTPNTIGEYVQRPNKAWTAAAANPYSIQMELCAFASWTPTQWAAHPTMLANCAQWIAEECAYYNIPIRRLTPSQAQGNGTGICGHVDLGTMGGNHWDPGPNFPMDQVIAMAAGQAPPTPTPQPGEDQMGLATAAGKTGRVLVEVDSGGNLWGKVQESGSARWSNANIGKGLDPNRLPAASVGDDGQMDAFATKAGGGVFHNWWQQGRGWNPTGETMA